MRAKIINLTRKKIDEFQSYFFSGSAPLILRSTPIIFILATPLTSLFFRTIFPHCKAIYQTHCLGMRKLLCYVGYKWFALSFSFLTAINQARFRLLAYSPYRNSPQCVSWRLAVFAVTNQLVPYFTLAITTSFSLDVATWLHVLYQKYIDWFEMRCYSQCTVIFAILPARFYKFNRALQCSFRTLSLYRLVRKFNQV